jgi:prolyl 4-hydroxylase
MYVDRNCEGPIAECQSKEKPQFTLEVVSTEPKVYIIENFFSDFEADQIIKYAKTRVAKSTVGQGDSGGIRTSDTRTSSNTWMPRTATDTTNTLYLRASDVLKVEPTLLTQNSEDMQVVHYDIGEKYDAHHDWGVSGYPESRYITLLLYLNDMPDSRSGGETSFPKGNGGTGIKVSPKKGTAVLFYSLLEDGNGDDLSLHQAIPVVKGEKWLANFWVWDPKKKR